MAKRSLRFVNLAIISFLASGIICGSQRLLKHLGSALLGFMVFEKALFIRIFLPFTPADHFRDCYDIAKLVELDCPEKAAQLRSFNLPKIEEEINLIRRHIDQLAPPVTFGHNDLTPPNIIWDEETESIALVDYEYAGYNFRGFDIGNFFTEHAGLHCDWTLYPKEDARLIFITAYLSALGDEPTEDQIRSLHREACSFSLASHLYWGLWGIVQAKNSMVDFDYLAYSRGRFDGYWLMKDEFLAL
eukprot:TRINITY_DN211_c0_g1_i2.p1 TRINITY_DN211_c0_g1~~TRINITY_DN211_c0_g1_i2.p1  ORF type:complete len:245 (+),score=42.34 TRINITY_DN211_c0_g1_i2:572-1306(+)